MLESVNPRLIFAAAVITVIAALVYRDRKQVERHSIVLMRRTGKGIDFINKLESVSPRFWKAYGWTGLALGILSLPLMLLQIGWLVFQNVLGTAPEASGGVIVPSLSSSTSATTGAIFVPVEYWVTVLLAVMVVHEFSHGVIAKNEGFSLDSVGWVIFGIIPGAFVQPEGQGMKEDEENGKWDHGTMLGRLKVFTAGSFANYLLGLVFILGIIGVAALPSGPELQYQAQQGFPAAEAGLNQGVLYSVNGTELENMTELREALNGTEPGQPITLNTSEGSYSFELGKREGQEGGYIGLRFGNTLKAWLLGLFNAGALLSIGIGLFNMLPAKPLDGGKVLEEGLVYLLGDRGIAVTNYISVGLWMAVLFALFGGFI